MYPRATGYLLLLRKMPQSNNGKARCFYYVISGAPISPPSLPPSRPSPSSSQSFGAKHTSSAPKMERFNRLLLFFLLWMLLSDSCRAAKLAAPNELSESEVSGFASSPYSSSCYGLSSNLGRLAAAVERIGQQQEHQPRSGRLFRGASVEDRLEELQGQVEALQEEISTLKRIGEGGQGDRVFFNVLRQRKLVCYGCIVSFDAASADTHDAFDLSTGTFVAPIGGHYFFQFHALVEDRYEAQVRNLRHVALHGCLFVCYSRTRLRSW